MPRRAAAKKPPDPTQRARRPRRKKVAVASTGLSPAEVAAEQPPDGVALAEQIRADGGAPLSIYRDPIGARTLVLAALPIEKVEPTPYQRDLSEPHVKRLAAAIERVGRYLDPMICIRAKDKYWTPNGNHRLGASRLLGAKTVIALVLPEPEVAYQILAMNTEKAHNLKERSLEVIRMYRGLVGAGGGGKETDHNAIFEEPAFITHGAAYEKRPRYSGGAYNPIVRRLDRFLELPLEEALEIRQARADKVLALDDEVARVVAGLKERGLTSPYLKSFVVARLNFLRFVKGEPQFDPTLEKMLGMARRFKLDNVKQQDLAKMGGQPAEAEE